MPSNARSPFPTVPALLGCLLAACDGPPDAAPRRPNLLLVSIDCLRADHVSCYGYERETTPNIDALAAEGVRFERAFSTTSWTLPAHLSMLTGLPVSAHGIDDDRLWTRVDARGEPVPPPLRGVFVSERLQDAGYRTAGFYTWKYLETQFGFGPGFEVWERLGHTFYSHPEVGPEWERLRAANDVEGMQALAAAHPRLFSDTTPSSPETIDRAVGWLRERVGTDDGAPFFLFVHLFDAHDPYHPPEPHYSMFDPDYEGPIDGRRVTAPDSPVRGDMPERDLARLVSLYDGAVHFVDSELGRLFDELDALDVVEDTLVIVTADHGEEFFEHGHKTHRRQLYMESVCVPLVLRWPAGLPAGRTVGGNVGLVDVAPTLCAAAGVDAGDASIGVDLLALARGEVENRPRTYVSELVLFDGGAVPERHLALARGDRHRVLTTRGRAPWRGEQFDLERNPWGRGSGAPIDAATESGAALRDEIDELRAALTLLREAQPPRSGTFTPLSELDQADLAAMGYGGHEEGDGVEAGEGEERLSLDGGVWPDE